MTSKRKRKPPAPVYIDFVCLACGHGYRTRLPRVLVAPAKAAWARVHWREDDTCAVAAREAEAVTA